MRCGAVGQLACFIRKRSLVRVQPPQPKQESSMDTYKIINIAITIIVFSTLICLIAGII